MIGNCAVSLFPFHSKCKCTLKYLKAPRKGAMRHLNTSHGEIQPCKLISINRVYKHPIGPPG